MRRTIIIHRIAKRRMAAPERCTNEKDFLFIKYEKTPARKKRKANSSSQPFKEKLSCKESLSGKEIENNFFPETERREYFPEIFLLSCVLTGKFNSVLN